MVARQDCKIRAAHRLLQPDQRGDHLGRVTQLGPTYGRVSSIQRGRLIKVGVSVEF